MNMYQICIYLLNMNTLRVLLPQLILEELYEAWRAKGKEENRRNTVVLQGFLTQNFALQAK